TTIHPIEVESYRILSERLDLSTWPARCRTVVERVVHATADVEFATTMVVTEATVAAGVAAIRAGAPVVTDVEMTRAGITGARAECFLVRARVVPGGAATRSAAAMRLAAEAHPAGAVVVIGCAPTALTEGLPLR